VADPTRPSLFAGLDLEPVEVGPSTEGGSLFAAFDTKVIDIDQAMARKTKNLDGTVLSKTGVDPRSVMGGILNTGASIVSGASRLAGNLATLPIDMASTMGQAGVPDAAINAYSRLQTGNSQPGDDLLLAQTAAGDDGIPQTNLQRMQGVDGLRQAGSAVDKFFDVSGIVDTTKRDELSDALKNNTAGGVAKLRQAADLYGADRTIDAIKTGGAGLFDVIGNAVKSGIQNPAAVGEYAAENLPQLIAAAYSGGSSLASNAGYGFDVSRQGITDFQAANNGALPDDAERLRMGLFATSAAGAEMVGDKLMLKGLSGAGKGNALKAAGAVVNSSAKEGVTEGYQTYAENAAALKDTTIEQVVEGASIGAFVGGTYQGATELAKPGQVAADKVATAKAVNAAADAGDVATLSKMGTATYDPVRAVQVLHKEAMADPAKTADSLKRADAIQKDLTTEISGLQERADLYTEQNKTGLATAIQTREAELAAAPAEEKSALRAKIKQLTGLQESFAAYTPEVAKAEAAQLKELTSTLDSTRAAAQQMQVDATPAAPELEAMVAKANSPEANVASQAAQDMLTLTMTNPEAFSPEAIDAVVNNASNGLSTEQRTALRTYSASQLAANELKGIDGVRSDVTSGGDGYKGINQFRDTIRLAMADGNTEVATQQVEGLKSFAASRASKAAAITQAYEAVKGSDAKVQLIRGQDGNWTQASQPMSARQLKSAGGVEVSAKSFKLRDAVQAEANVLASTAEAFGALIQANPQPVQTNAPADSTVAVDPATDSPVVAPVPDAEQPAANEPAADNVATKSAGLTALQNKPQGEVSAENYQDTNLVAAYFDQSAGKDMDATKKPLASTDDFMSKLRAGDVKLTDFVKLDGPPTAAQTLAVGAFGKFQRWSAPFIAKGFTKNPGKGTERFRFKDYAQFLLNADGSVDENVSTAVSFSMFNWANDNATKLTNDQAGINAILGQDSDADISRDAFDKLAGIGIRESAVAASVGADVVAALGLKPNQSAPSNELARMEASLGAQVIGSLVRAGMAERVQISDVELQKLMNSGVASNPKGKHTFIRVKTSRVDDKLTANAQVAGIRTANTGAQSIISKLFGAETSAVEPSYTPVDFTQAKAKRTNQDVPPVLAERLNKEAKKPHTVRPEVWHVWNNVSSDFLYKVGGAVDINDSPTHAENLASRTAKNDGLVQQVDNARAFITAMEADKGLEQPLYFDRSVWKPQRVGLTATVLNPQTSKAARYLLAMEGWETNLDLNSKAMMDGFKLRILEAFDTKTENGKTVDVLAGYDKVVSKPEIVSAVNELAKVLRDEHTVADEEVLLAGVKAGGAGFHSLDGLMALAVVQNAQAAGQTQVKVTLTGEVDGVTNGPMLSLLMLGAKDFSTMNQGGFFSVAQPYAQFNDFKADGNLDLYQSTIAGVLALLPVGDARLAALQVITGTLQDEQTGAVTSKGRNIIKKPLTAMMFGSNTTTAVLNMADGFIDTIYASIENLAAKNDEAGLVTLLTAVNTTIGKAGLGLNTGMGIAQAMEYKLTSPQKEALKAKFMDLLGKPAEDALNANYELFLARRDVVNQSAQLAFELYNAAKEALTESVVANAPDIARDGKGNALTSLTRKQEAEIEKRLKAMEPVLATAMSKESGSLASGMHMSKTQRSLDASQQFSSEVFLGGNVPTIQPDGSVATPQRAELSGMRTALVSPGVAPFITSIHSTDSAIASGAYTQMNALNVHDALIVGLENVEKVGQALNQQTFQNMLNYSAPAEMVATLERTLAGIPSLLADEAIAPLLQPKLQAMLSERNKKKRGTVEAQLAAVRHVATTADMAKLSMLVEMKAVNQYATDGGSYVVTAADRAEAQAKLDAVGQYNAESLDVAASIDDLIHAAPLVLKPSAPVALSNNSVQTRSPATGLNALEHAKKYATPELAQAITTVQEAMVAGNLPLASAKTVLTPEVAAEVMTAAEDTVVGRTSVWGEIGTPLVSSDASLVAFLSQAKDLTAHQFIDHLTATTKDVFTKNLLTRVKQATRANVKVVYVTAETGPEGAQGTGVSKARGWYNQTNGSETLFVKSPDFVESGLTEELSVHELLHGALATTIERAQNGGPSEAKDLVNDLEDLRKQAADLLATNGALSAKFANAVSSVHELVSWGMTNADFQQQVLKNLSQKEVRGNALTDGLKSFIQRLTFLIFRKDVKAAQLTGLGLLINHTSGLLADAAKLHGERESLTLQMSTAVNNTNLMTTAEIYEALGAAQGVTSAHDAQMRGLLAGIVTSLHGPYGSFHKAMQSNQALTTTDVYLKALDTGNRPFASQALTSAFVMSKQEAYVLEQVEATVAAAMESQETLFVRTALEQLFRDARAKTKDASALHNGDWATASQNEQDIAQAKFDFLFRPEAGVTKSAYLSRFAALAMASQEVSGLLNFGTTRVEQQLNTLPLGARIIELFRRVLTKLASLHNKTSLGAQANVTLVQLVDRLVDIEAKRRQRINDGKVSVLDQVELGLVNVGDRVRGAIVNTAESTFFTASAKPLVKAVGAAVSALAGDRVGDIMDRATLIRDAAFKKRQGLLIGLVSEARGVTDSNALAAGLFKDAKQNETDRKQHIEFTIAQVMAAFKDGGQYLTEAVKTTLTKTLLRTNVSALLTGRTMADLSTLLESPDAQRAERSRLEQDLLTDPNGRYYIRATKDLALHKVVGGSVSANQMLNTSNIANLYGTAKANTALDAKATTAKLDQLMALYALDYSSTQEKSAMIDVLRTENARGTQDNGIEMILKLHAGLQAEAKTKLFDGSEALAITGFTPEIHDSKIEVLWVEQADLKSFEMKGYTKAGNVQKDETSPVNQDLVMVSRRGSGQTGLLTGAVSYTGMHAKGSKLDRKAINAMSGTAKTSKAVMASIKVARAQAINEMFLSPLSYDPRKAKSGKLVPVMNPNGDIVDYRYMMTELNRDVLLDRNSAMDQVLGTLAGQIVDKVSSVDQNANVIGALYDQYKADYANRPASYLKVGADSTDKQLLELYNLMPEQAKKDMRRVWKGDNMYVPADQLNLIMGYRKYSLTEGFNDPDSNWAEKILVRVAGAIFGEKAELRVGQAEDVMQELVKLTKDILVVKNIVTMVGNIMSNMTLLAAQGVSLPQAIRTHAIGLKGAMSYRADNKRLIQLTRAQDIGYIPQGIKAVEDEIAEIKDRMARNPVKVLIDAGLMPTIVEDVEADDSQYSYSSRLTRVANQYTGWVPQSAKDAAKQVFMTHDTSTYKFLSQTTQLSDFVARYTMYEYLTTRNLDPLSSADAIKTAEDSFVNYDIPSHRIMQFMNDMGIVWFTKYYMRIQKTIMRLVKERPARVLALAAANHYVTGLQSLLDSSWVNHIGGNPFSTGAANFPSSLDELPWVKGFLNLMPSPAK
jgi:hypothetical protein